MITFFVHYILSSVVEYTEINCKGDHEKCQKKQEFCIQKLLFQSLLHPNLSYLDTSVI